MLTFNAVWDMLLGMRKAESCVNTYIGQKQIQLLKDGKWESYSGSMLVEKRDGTETISGPGFIRQINQNYFQITIFDLSVEGGYKESLLQLLAGSKFQPGQIIPQSEQYRLVTKDGWRSDWLSEPDNYFTETGTITTFYTREIFSERAQDIPNVKAGVRFTAFREYKDYPSNKVIRYGKFIEGEGKPGWHLCVADVNVWNYSLRLIVHDGESTLRLLTRRNKKKHNDSIEFRAIEALEFVLGEPFEWNIKSIFDSKHSRQHVLLTPHRLSVRSSKPYSDIWTPKSQACVMFWELYGKFLRYGLKEKTSYISDIGGTLRNLACLRSSEQEISAYILSLCVAIEDLLVRHFTKEIKDRERDKLIRQLLRMTHEFLRTREVDEALKSNIKSHIGLLKSSRENAKKTLLRLAGERKVLERRVMSWGYLRNKVAHGRRIKPTQDILNKIGDVETLLYQIVFQLIAYKGKYTDYGTIGFPNRSYPKEL